MAPEMTVLEEHEKAERKHGVWLDEIDRWRADHKLALETLEDAATFVREHDALLDHHAEAMAEHSRRFRAARAAAADPGRVDGRSAEAEDQSLRELHQRILEQHNRFRGRHPALIQEIGRLAVALHKVSHRPG